LPFIKNGNPLRVSVGATAYVKRLSRHKRWRIYSTFHLTTPFALLLFGGGRGAGLAPQILSPCAHPAEPVLPYNGADGNGTGLLNPAPRFRRRNDTAKIRPVKGLRRKIFPPLFAGKYSPALDWTDRRSGLIS